MFTSQLCARKSGDSTWAATSRRFTVIPGRHDTPEDGWRVGIGGVVPAEAVAVGRLDAEPEPRLPFWPLLFKNITIRLVGSDDLPEDAERCAAADITACLKEGLLRPRVGVRFPLGEIAEAHEAVEGGRAGDRVVVDVG
jgi:Zinc-binding dehydrogenase